MPRRRVLLAPCVALVLGACAGGGAGDSETDATDTMPMKASVSASSSASATGSTSAGETSTSTGGEALVPCAEPEAGVGDVGYELLLTPEPPAGSYHLDLLCTISGMTGSDVYDGVGLLCDDDGVETIASLFVSNGQLLLPKLEFGAEVRLEVVKVEAESSGVAVALRDAADMRLLIGVNTGPFVPPVVDGVDVLSEFWAPLTVAPALTDCDDERGLCAALRRRAALRVTHTLSAAEALVLDHQVATVEGYGIHVGAAYVDVGDDTMCDGGVSTDLRFLVVDNPA
jgi:hypothetical protein